MKKPPRQLLVKSFPFIVLGLVVCFIFLIVFGSEGLLKLKDLYRLKDQVQKENQELFKNNQKLKSENTLLKEPTYTEQLIREKLGYVKSNEKILILNENESQPFIQPAHAHHQP